MCFQFLPGLSSFITGLFHFILELFHVLGSALLWDV